MRKNTDLILAKRILAQGRYTCVLVSDKQCLTTTLRGVAPLLAWLDAGVDLTSYTAADRVVGRAAAYLYVLLGVKTVHATVASQAARAVAEQYGLTLTCDTVADAIRNRTDTGNCPMETATEGATSPDDALARIRRTLTALQKKPTV